MKIFLALDFGIRAWFLEIPPVGPLCGQPTLGWWDPAHSGVWGFACVEEGVQSAQEPTPVLVVASGSLCCRKQSCRLATWNSEPLTTSFSSSKKSWREIRFIPHSAGAFKANVSAYSHNFHNRLALYTWTLTSYVMLWVCIFPKACQPYPFHWSNFELQPGAEENADIQLGLRVHESGSEKKTGFFLHGKQLFWGAA